MARVIEQKIYAINELSPEARDRAINDWIEGDDLPGMSDDMREELHDLLDEAKIKYTDNNLRVFYSLAYCQGDGAMFEGTFEWRGYSVAVKHFGFYYHEYSKTMYIETRHGNEAKQAIYETFGELYVQIAKKLAEFGYSYIEAEHDAERVAAHLQDCGYEFYADGSAYNERV